MTTHTKAQKVALCLALGAAMSMTAAHFAGAQVLEAAAEQAKRQKAAPMVSDRDIEKARAQIQLPSDAAMAKQQQLSNARNSEALNRANEAFQSGTPLRSMPKVDLSGLAGKNVDPAVIAQRYLDANKLEDNSDNPQVMIFVSLSMPEQSLLKIGADAKKAGVVVVLRGPRYSLQQPGGWMKSLKAMEPIGNTGADVQIHPELFKRFNVTAVPTVVVTSDPKQGCQDDACANNAASVVGDVSLDYALSELAKRRDQVGRIAESTVAQLRNSK